MQTTTTNSSPGGRIMGTRAYRRTNQTLPDLLEGDWEALSSLAPDGLDVLDQAMGTLTVATNNSNDPTPHEKWTTRNNAEALIRPAYVSPFPTKRVVLPNRAPIPSVPQGIPEGSWLQHRASRATGTRAAGTRALGTIRTINQTGGTVRGGSQFHIVGREFRPGTIIWHRVTIEIDQIPSRPLKPDEEIFTTNDGRIHLRKDRFQIVYGVSETGWQELWIYTNGGLGLAGMTEKEKLEWKGLQPRNLSDNQYEAPNLFTPARVSAMTRTYQNFRFKDSSAIKVSALHWCSYEATEVEVLGHLDARSMEEIREQRRQLGLV